jgi:hypothetical protein
MVVVIERSNLEITIEIPLDIEPEVHELLPGRVWPSPRCCSMQFGTAVPDTAERFQMIAPATHKKVVLEAIFVNRETTITETCKTQSNVRTAASVATRTIDAIVVRIGNTK